MRTAEFSVLNVLLVWLAARPALTLGLVYAAHGAIAHMLERVLPPTGQRPGSFRLRSPASGGLVQRVQGDEGGCESDQVSNKAALYLLYRLRKFHH